jgi:hypothetical protein
MISQYQNPLLSGSDCMIEDGFIPIMDLFCSLLEQNNCKAYIVSSFRQTTIVPGAIVTPSEMSNHLVGHAIDVNLIDSTGKFWNSISLKPGTLSGDVANLIKAIEASDIRWGGEFQACDDVHFDDGLNLRNPNLWQDLYQQINQPA